MPVTFQQARLENGLTIVAETDPEAHTAACGFFVKTGARDEASPVMGVSHFLEHMMFKGTPTRTAEDVNRDFDRLGAQYNAYTSSELTCFYASVIPEALTDGVDILADILRPSLRQEDFDTEKNVILEEIAMYKDSPFWVLYEKTLEAFYADHPLAHRVLGTDDTIAALTRDQMQAYFDERYSPDNTVVALAGKLDFERVVAQLGDRCGHWSSTGATRDAAAPKATGERVELTSSKFDRAYMLAVAPGPSIEDDRRYAAMMLAKILGDPGNSRLHWSLIETGRAEEAMAAYDGRDGCGEFYVYASGEPDRADEIWSGVEKEIAGLIDSVEEGDLERLRNTLATSVTLAGERPSGRMQRLGRLQTYLGTQIPLETELERINAVTLDDLRETWAAFPMSPRTNGRLMPGG